MNIRGDIAKYADPNDIEILNWLFDRYHWSSKWYFVADREYVRSTEGGYYCIWRPTFEGEVLYRARKEYADSTPETKRNK